jgi:hypothetical protein
VPENYPQFSGGEPSLNTTALEIAAKHWQHGIIYTNGIKKGAGACTISHCDFDLGCEGQ